MLAGSRPFRADGEALIHAIRNDPPPVLSTVRSDLPSALGSIVERCLEKDPERRFESADALVVDLRNARISMSASRAGRRSTKAATHSRRRFAPILATGALAAIVLAALSIRSGGKTAPSALTRAASPGIAVLPFEVKDSGLDVWREGMVDLLSTNLDGVPGLRAIDSRTVLARWREGGREADAPDLETALDKARQMGARYAVLGGVVSSGTRIRLDARIYAVENGSSLASLEATGPPDSLFTLVDRLSIDILAAIWQGKERPEAQVDLTRITTTSLPALKAFLDGERLLRRADFEGAVAAYERAVAADSTFAYALYHLGLAQSWLGNGEQYRRAHEAALRHADRLPPREALVLRATAETAAHVVDLPTSIGLYQEATRRYPDDPDAWYQLGDRYWHDGEQLLLPSLEESEKAFRTTVELDPGFAPAYIHLVTNAFKFRPDSARAARLIERYHRLAPNSANDQENRIAFGVAFGDSTTRRQALAALDTLLPGTVGWLGDGYLDHPRLWAQREVVLERVPRPNNVQGWILTFDLFDNNLSRGRLKAALAYLDDPLMSDPLRYAGLYRIHAAGLPAPGLSLDEALTLRPADSLAFDIGSIVTVFYAGAFAADRGRWGDHAAAVARLRSQANALRAAGDSASFRFTMGAATALSGQGLWRRGDAEGALRLLVEGQRRTTWGVSLVRNCLNGTIRWWLGELLLERGRPQEAARYFESFWNDPLAADRLARIYDRMGERVKALQADALVALAWQDADPEFQPLIQEARRAVTRLSGAED
jgi:tetratricopeptide (TPR) repeat protein